MSGRGGHTLHLAPAHVATDTRVFWKEARSLRQAGWSVTVVALHDRDETLEGVEIVGLRRGRGWGSRLRNLLRVLRAVRHEHADIVHVHDFEVLPLAIVLGLLGHRVVLDFHEDYPLLVQSRSYVPPRLRRSAAAAVRLIERVAASVAVGVISAEEAGALRFEPIPVGVVRNHMLESEIEQLNATGDGGSDVPVAVYVGTVNRERGLLEMVESVQLAGPDVELHLVGDVPSELHDLVWSLDGGRQVHEYGRCDRARTCEILASSSVGLVLWHPTPKHAGGAVPVKLFEYMAAGLPVVASDFPEIRSVIGTTGAGFLVNPLETATIARHLRWIADHPEEARAMGAVGRDLVRARYTWGAQVPTLLNVYDRAIEGSRRWRRDRVCDGR